MLQNIANTLRVLAADMVEKANSGHPGMPLGCAEMGTILFTDLMRHDPSKPDWPNRDRFVLSAGHGSALLYSLLHLTGYPLTLEDLKQFRQLGSHTPGHPEYGLTPGIETTTGPLGQGIANAVGMAWSEAMLAAKFNRPGYNLIDHYIYVIAGDGDLMEGVSAEASSLAGHLGLNKLIVLYDSNRITIEGDTDLAFTESVADRYRSYNWQVQKIDGHNLQEIAKAVNRAKAENNRPSLIIAETTIGRYSPQAGTPKVHGAPLGKDAVRALKEALNVPVDSEFYVPEQIYDFFSDKRKEWKKQREEWESLFSRWAQAFPELKKAWDLKDADWDIIDQIPAFPKGHEAATRQDSNKVLQHVAKLVPNLIGGSADLAPSNLTLIDNEESISRGQFAGRNLHFGVREHAMGAILNGIALHGYFRVYGGTFLVFSDYMRPPIRLASLMELGVIYIFTHDSIYVGEDGPTHQPIEQVESLRIIPGLRVFRPADGEEVRYAWAEAIKRTDGPTAIILTRQKLPVLKREPGAVSLITKGGYVAKKENHPLSLTIAAAGSEVWLAYQVAEELEKKAVGVRVVSVPSRELFLSQDQEYIDSVLPPTAPRLILEVGVSTGWHTLTNKGDVVYGIDCFGKSGPANEVAKHFGFTKENITTVAENLINQ